MTTDRMVAVHPESGRDPAEVRWVAGAAALRDAGLDFVGVVRELPGALGRLLDRGAVEQVRVEPDAVVVRLPGGRSWREAGAEVRTALLESLGRGSSWQPVAARDADTVLRAAVESVLAGPTGDYVRSHGGRIEVVSAHQDEVRVQLHGTCVGCPAAGVTLDTRLDAAVRALYPGLRSISATTVPSSGPRLLRLGPRVRRR
ncbi:MAG: NifU family protein [Marmoricola sp.]